MHRLLLPVSGIMLASLVLSPLGLLPNRPVLGTSAAQSVVVKIAEGGRIHGLSPDGKRLAIRREDALCVQALAAMAEETCAKWNSEAIHQESVIWSPDSEKIAFTEDVAPPLIDSDLWITGDHEEADGFTWWPVREPEIDITGYVPVPFLSLPPGMSIEAIPTASPSPIAADTSGSLQSMLAKVPASLAPTAAGDMASYANIAAQLNAVGVEPRSGADEEELDDWIPAISGLALPSSLGQHALNEQWRETFGFDVFQVDQTLQLGQPPDMVTLLQGKFDETELRAAWARSGYQDVDVEGPVVASLAPGPEVDLNSPVGRLALGSMNNAVLLADGTLVFAANLDRIEAILAVEAGDEPSLAEDPSIADLLASAPEELATGLLIPGEALHTADADVVNQIVGGLTDEEIDALATEIASTGDQPEAMPPVRLALLGITAGGPISASNADDAGGPDQTEAQIAITLLMANRAAAEHAAAVVLSRLEEGVSSDTGEPYAQFFPERSAEAAPEEPVVLVTLTTGERPARVIFEMYYRRDLGFLAW